MSAMHAKSSDFYSRAKREIAEGILDQALNLLAHAPEGNYRLLAAAFSKIANNEQQKLIAGWVSHWLAAGNPGGPFISRVLRSIHPNVRRKYISRMVTNNFFRDPDVLGRFYEMHGFNPPAVVVISPTMKCNYRCVGCWAGEYAKLDELPAEVFDRVLTEAEEIGTHFFVLTGGEPLVYKALLDIMGKHRDSCFQLYTNGALVDEEMAERFVELGNVSPQISIEGFEKETDERRGQGAFRRAMRAMEILREKGCLLAFSSTVTRKNIDAVTSDEFIDLLIGKGVHYGWYFMYMPIGRQPDLSLMLTPEERNRLRKATIRIRNIKPILVADFWGDGPLTGGCIAGGRIYLHITARGDVEPCVFQHFATHNVKESSFTECLKSPLFAALRRMQPFCYNTLRPCPIVDHPKML
ncbi:MAG: radical SAM protein, partial [Chloroflexota bacterium]